MRRLCFAVVAALVTAWAVPAMAGPPDSFWRRPWSEVQSSTRAAPTLDTEGVQLREGAYARFIVEADSGQTLSGVGSLNLWVYDLWDGTTGAWAMAPLESLTIPSECAGQRRCVVGTKDIGGPRLTERILAATSGVTVSAGAVTVRIFLSVSGRSISN